MFVSGIVFWAPQARDTGALDTAQARRLWETTAGRPRTRALVAVLLFCGLRISEALTLHTTDLDTQHGAAVLRVTRQRRQTPAPPSYPPPPSSPSTTGSSTAATSPGRCSPPAPAPRWTHELRTDSSAGSATTPASPDCTRNTLRHTFATSAVDTGADVLKVATALGHALPSTTMQYVRGRDVITNSPVHAVAAAIVNG